ncbi:MAG: right-handed parallel beta-helix repeat-containing protein [Candidatus Hodarchaeales archaeon]
MMKRTKSTVGLVLLIFLLNIGFFAEREGVIPNVLTQESLTELRTSSDIVETSTVTKTNEISYERNEWELNSIIQRKDSQYNPNRVELPSFSISSIQYVPHIIIQIDGNDDFLAYNFTGKGTNIEPYIIANLSITASFTHLISIRNTDAFFEIRDNYLDGINRSYNAIFFKNVTNGLVTGNTILNVENGAYLEESYFNLIQNNEIFNTSSDGINLWASSFVDIHFNHIWGVDINGISVSDACNLTTINGNNIDGIGGWAGIYLGGSYGSQVTNNVIGYVYDGNGIVLGYWGMSPRDTAATINNNTIYASRYRGIRVEFASSNSITKNTVHENGEDGIHLYSSSGNLIELNKVFSNTWDGILIDGLSENNQIYTNVLTDNSVGIHNDNSSNNDFYGNGIFESRAQGIIIARSNNIELFFNDIMNSWGSAIYSWGTTSNLNIGNNSLSLNSAATQTNPEIWGSGIYVTNFDGIIAGNVITDNHYFGIYVEVGSDGQIYGNYISGNGFTGISLINVTYTGIADNRITENGGNGIFCMFSDYNTLIVNKIMGNGGNGIFLLDSNFNEISENEIANNHGTVINPLSPEIKFSIQASTNGHGVFLDPCIGNVISGNTIYGNAGSGTYLFDSSGNEILDNEIVDNNENGVFLEGSSGNKVLRNYIGSNGDPELLQTISKGEILFKMEASTNGHGVFLDPTSENVISDNTIENNVRNGVQLYMSDGSLISDNVISGNENGIALEDSNGNSISQNTIFENGFTSEKRLIEYPFLRYSIQASTNGHGVFLDPSDYNIIQGNNIFGNSGNGIFLVDSDNTKVLNNVLSVNMQYGVNVDPTSTSSLVSNNDFFENNFEPGSQARDDGLDSFFDHNYWSDWIGEGSYKLDGNANNADVNPADIPNNSPGYSFPIPKVIYPNGGEILDNIEPVSWKNVHSAGSSFIQYWLSYSRDGGSSWVNILMESYEIVIISDDNTTHVRYMWDTTTVENGDNYLLKVIAVDQNGFSTFDTSDDVFVIKNEGGEPTTTTKTTTETTGPQISPSWSYIISAIGLTVLFRVKRRKKK